MIIAKKLKKTNISEYLIYMFQIEDLIRSNSCDFDELNQNLLTKYKQPENVLSEIKKWYKALCRMMNEEKLQNSGHLQFVVNQIKELTDFHFRLIELSEDENYIKLFKIAAPDIQQLRNKIPSKPSSDIEVLLYALYSLMILRLKKTAITAQTLEAMTNFSNLLAYLSAKYKNFEVGEIEI